MSCHSSIDEKFIKDFNSHFGYWNGLIENMNDRDELETDIQLLEALDHQFTSWQDDLSMKILSNLELTDEERHHAYEGLTQSERFKKLRRMSIIVRRIIVRYKALNELKNRRTAENINLRTQLKIQAR